MSDLTPEQKCQVCSVVEALGDLICQEADGYEDDELVCLQSVVDACARACGQPTPTPLPNDGWVEAGVIRARTRELRAAMARGQI
jgi:hypothetical protein